MSPGLSVCVLARDEAELLPRCLASVAWADEIVVVVDARSRDDSEKLAKLQAHRVERRPYEGDIEQKRYCASLASHDWVMILDPDEVAPPALEAELRAAMARGDADGFEINRVTWHLGRWLRHGDFHPDWTLRIYRAAAGRWLGENPHGRVAVAGRVRRLASEIEHYSYRDLADQVERIQAFSDQAARAMAARGRRARWWDLALRPPARFLRGYVLKQGFRDGVPGFVVAAATSFYVLLKYAKLWERQRLPRS